MSINQPKRWFPNVAVMPVVSQLMTEVAEAGLNEKSAEFSRYSERQLKSLNIKSYLFLGGVGLFIAAVLFLPEFLPKEWLAKTENLNQVVKFIAIAVPIGLGFAAKKRLARANQRIEKHDTSIEKLVEQVPALCCTHAAPMSTSVDIIPMMETSYPKSNLRCSLFGEYKENALALLEAEYLAAREINSATIAAKFQADLVSDPDKEQFSRVRSGQAVVFFSPIDHLPDLFICGKDEPICGYLKTWVKSVGASPAVSELELGSQFRGYTSCVETAMQTIPNEFFEILKLRPKSMVQVIGGYVVVMPRSWSAATPMDMAVDAFEVQMDLDFASSLYEHLSTGNTYQSKIAENQELISSI